MTDASLMYCTPHCVDDNNNYSTVIGLALSTITRTEVQKGITCTVPCMADFEYCLHYLATYDHRRPFQTDVNSEEQHASVRGIGHREVKSLDRSTYGVVHNKQRPAFLAELKIP